MIFVVDTTSPTPPISFLSPSPPSSPRSSVSSNSLTRTPYMSTDPASYAHKSRSSGDCYTSLSQFKRSRQSLSPGDRPRLCSPSYSPPRPRLSPHAAYHPYTSPTQNHSRSRPPPEHRVHYTLHPGSPNHNSNLSTTVDYTRDQVYHHRRHSETTEHNIPTHSPRASSTRRRSAASEGQMNRRDQQSFNTAPPSPALWSDNIFYPQGALVWHAGSVWRCDSPHTSGSLALEPTQSLHLWTTIGSISGYTPPIGAEYTYTPTYSRDTSRDDDRARSIALREEQDAARDPAALRDELLGARIWRVGGVGVWAYHEDPEVERIRRGAWREFTEGNGRDEWLRAARARTAAYAAAESKGQLVPLVRWHLIEGSSKIPQDAISIGHEADGKVLYAARVWHEHGLHIGKAGDHLFGRCEYSYDGITHAPSQWDTAFEVLCGSPEVLEWIPFEGDTGANIPGGQPVEGGRERDGVALMVARAHHDESIQPGKAQIDETTAMIPYGGEELDVRPFEILAYSTLHRR